MKSVVAGAIVVVVVVATTSHTNLKAAIADDRPADATRQTRPQRAPVDGPKLTVRVSPLVRLTRGDSSGVVIVPRHTENRMLRVILESEDYFRLSEVQLEGEDAPLAHPLYWRDLPPGSYCVTVQVYGTTGLRGSTSIGSTKVFGSDR